MTGLKWKTRNKWWQNRNQWPKLIIHPVLYIFKSSMQHIHLLNLKHGEEHYQNTLGLNLTYKMKLTLSGTSTHFSMQWRETEIHGWHEETSFHFLLLFSENIVSLEIMVTTHNPSFFQICDHLCSWYYSLTPLFVLLSFITLAFLFQENNSSHFIFIKNDYYTIK